MMPDENSLQKQYHAEPTDRSLSRPFDARVTSAFCERSVSEETRRAYRRVTREFFRFTGPRHPAEITPQDVQRWRDRLISEKKSSSTVAFKLSIVRSLFDYLHVGGFVTRNPALAKLVPPPAVPEDLRGRALSGPNREKAEGA
jgi:site-specific recombinase XerD